MKLVIQNSSKVWGGNEKWLANVASGLASRGHDVVVSCARGAVQDDLEKRGIRTSRFRPRGAIDVASGLSFAAWLALESPDTLLLTSWHPISWCVWSARRARVRRIVLRQGIVRKYPAGGPRRMALGHVDAVIANSREITDIWDRTAPARVRGRVEVVLNGVEATNTERSAARSALRAELNIEPGTVVIGGAGHLFARKGFDILLRAFARAAIPDSRVVIAGEGGHRLELERLVSELGVAHRVHLLGHRNDGSEIIAGLDLFVLSSHNEGMANVMLEAMAARVPVIASDVSGVREAVGASESRPAAGWIVPPADVEALAEILTQVVPQLCQRRGGVADRIDEAHWRVSRWFGIDRMVDECEAILFP